MEGPRAPSPNEYNEIVDFLDKSLRDNVEWSIVSEYPTALQQQNINNMRVIKNEEGVLSHAVLRPLIVKTPSCIFKAAAIGSVVTNSNHRNQGLSAQIIQNCLDEGLRQDCDIAILWTNLFDFYRKFGFELAGSEVSLIVENPMELQPSTLVIKEGNNVDPAAIYKLYSRHTVGAVRTIEEIRQYLKIPNSRIYTAWDQTGALQAFAVEGKGADLDGYVHEWGGGVNELTTLINYIHKRQNRTITMIAPVHAVTLIQKFRQLGVTVHEGYLGMIKILNTEALFNKIVRHARHDHGFKQFVLEKQGDQYTIGNAQSLFRTSSEADMVRLLFGPPRPSDLHKFDPKTVDILNQIFPLRLWFWGWDSI